MTGKTVFKPVFAIGQEVYFALGGDNCLGMVRSITLDSSGLRYEVVWQDKAVSSHPDIELRTERPWAEEEAD